MDAALIERLKAEIHYEFERTGVPEGFPDLPDIPAARYTDQAFYDLEQAHIFARSWLFAGHQSDLPNVGSYQPWDYSGVPMVLVRDEERKIRAFLNTSPNAAPLTPYHDDSALIHEVPFDAPGRLFLQQVFPRRELPGGVLRCQRKGWCYDLTGRLKSLPMGQLLDQVAYKDRALIEFRCEVWDGFIFVNRDRDATPLIEWLGPVADQMKQFQGASLRMKSRALSFQQANWKVVNESFQEVYHFKHIHHHDGVVGLDQRGATMGLLPNGHSRMLTPYSKRQQVALGMDGPTDWRERPEGAVRQGLVAAPEIKTVAPLVKGAVLTYSLFPNFITPLSAMGFPLIMSWPIDPGHTLLEWSTFTLDWGEDTPEIEAMRQAERETPHLIMEQDSRNMAPMFLSLSSPGLPGVHVGYQERRIYYSHEYLDHMMGPERIPERLRVAPLLERYVERA